MKAGKHTVEVIGIERWTDELATLQVKQSDQEWHDLNKAQMCAIDGVGCANGNFS